MTAAPGVLGTVLAATSTKANNGSPLFLILIVVLAAFYFLIYRPQQKKQRAARTMSNSFEVGDEVVTAGGIVGYVIDITDDRVTLETSVGASFVVLRPYILRKIDEQPTPPDVVGDADADAGADANEPGPDDGPHDETAAEDTGPGTTTTGGTEKAAGGGDEADGTDDPGASGPPII
ncbi:MAG: preprotein translocase subunit YajC [Acidimicrobiales bacterium]|jgi:preprotein translocase subunit YajC